MAATPGLPIETQLIISLVTSLVLIPLGALFLWLSSKLLKVPVGYKRALLPAFIIGLVTFLFSATSILIGQPLLSVLINGLSFAVTIALYLLLPKLLLGLEWKKGLLVGLLWWAFMLAVGFIFSLVVMAIGVAILAAMYGQLSSAMPPLV